MARKQHVNKPFVQRKILLSFSKIVEIVRVFELLFVLKIFDFLEGCFVSASKLFDDFSVGL